MHKLLNDGRQKRTQIIAAEKVKLAERFRNATTDAERAAIEAEWNNVLQVEREGCRC